MGCDAKSLSLRPSLNEYLKAGTSFHNFLWNILIQNDFSPIALCGDIKQAFLKVRIKEEHRFT